MQMLETLTTSASDLTLAPTSEGVEIENRPVEKVSESVENVSEAIAPDLLGHAPPEMTAEAIVEELLEAISAQEAAGDQDPNSQR